MSTLLPTLLSLDDLQPCPNDAVREYLASDFEYFERVLNRMKIPPKCCIFRVNLLMMTVDEAILDLRGKMSEWVGSMSIECDIEDAHGISFSVNQHSILPDVVQIDIITTSASTTTAATTPSSSEDLPVLFPNWPKRDKVGWPKSYKVVVCDRFCGEAVLKGSNIFVGGIMAADAKISTGELVAVYADIPGYDHNYSKSEHNSTGESTATTNKATKTNRGALLDTYQGTAVYIGVGKTTCDRASMFSQKHGLGVVMLPIHRAGPILPPLSDWLVNKAYAQNLPSILVAHVLDVKPGQVIFDMCAAPGGKTMHVASLVKNNALIVAADKSRKKMITASATFLAAQCTSIVPLALDSANCCNTTAAIDEWKSAQQVIDNAKLVKGLLDIKQFYPASFDRILLDPPCSALGLRPKLQILQSSVDELEAFARYQKMFVEQSVNLLKPGGYMTYSTCTIHALENECTVRHILDKYAHSMELVPVDIQLGGIGLAGHGLNDSERHAVRRFDTTDDELDTMGFFIAKFRKKA